MGNVFYRSTFHDREGQLAVELKAERKSTYYIKPGGKVLAPIVLQQTGWLASILVFGPKGLILGSSMALIPTKMIHDFLKGKFTDYVIMW